MLVVFGVVGEVVYLADLSERHGRCLALISVFIAALVHCDHRVAVDSRGEEDIQGTGVLA